MYVCACVCEWERDKRESVCETLIILWPLQLEQKDFWVMNLLSGGWAISSNVYYCQGNNGEQVSEWAPAPQMQRVVVRGTYIYSMWMQANMSSSSSSFTTLFFSMADGFLHNIIKNTFKFCEMLWNAHITLSFFPLGCPSGTLRVSW